MKIIFQIIGLVIFPFLMSAQDIDVAGKAIIRTMDQDSFETDIVVKQSDGTLAYKELDLLLGVQIGDIYQGGIVFYTYDGGKHGLIMSIEDLGDSLPWGLDTQDLPETSNPYKGQENTESIIDFYGTTTNYAALECSNYVKDGFADWYLPSLIELRMVMREYYLVNTILENDGDSQTIPLDVDSQYWSSTQYFTGTIAFASAWNWVNNYTWSKTHQGSDVRVRAIRKF